MIEPRYQKLVQYLKDVGRLATTTGETIQPPNFIYKNKPQKILHLLDISDVPLTVKEIANYLGDDYEKIRKALYKITPSPTAKLHLMKTKRNNKTHYSFILPHGFTIESFYSKIMDDIKLRSEISFHVKKNPVFKRMCDLLNTYPANSNFTSLEFMDAFKTLYGDEAARGTVAVFLSRALRLGYIISERSKTDGRKNFYIKIQDIKDDDSTKLAVHTKEKDKIVDLRSKRGTTNGPTQFIDPSLKVEVSFKQLKEMETLVYDQDKNISELKKHVAQLLDENTNLTTDNRLLNEKMQRRTPIKEYEFDTDQFRKNLQ